MTLASPALTFLQAEGIHLPFRLHAPTIQLGVDNPTNVCYMNALLQCFLRHPRMAAFLQREHQATGRNGRRSIPGTSPGCALRDVLQRICFTGDQQQANRAARRLHDAAANRRFSQVSLMSSLTLAANAGILGQVPNPWTPLGTQQDAPEWYQYVYEWLMLREPAP